MLGEDYPGADQINLDIRSLGLERAIAGDGVMCQNVLHFPLAPLSCASHRVKSEARGIQLGNALSNEAALAKINFVLKVFNYNVGESLNM